MQPASDGRQAELLRPRPAFSGESPNCRVNQACRAGRAVRQIVEVTVSPEGLALSHHLAHPDRSHAAQRARFAPSPRHCQPGKSVGRQKDGKAAGSAFLGDESWRIRPRGRIQHNDSWANHTGYQ